MKTSILNRSTLAAAMFAILAVCGASTFAQPSKKDQKKANQLIEQAEKSFREKNYRNAIDQYAQSIVLVPSNGKSHYWKGYAHFYLQEYDQTVSELDQAEKLNYPQVDILKLRWYVNYLRKDYDAAFADVKQLLQLDPKDLNALKGYGEISFNKGSYADALTAFQSVAAQEPNNADIYYNIAQCQYNLGDVAGQAAAAEEAVKRNTRFLAEANFLRGDAYRKQKRNALAIEAFSSSLAQKTDLLDTYIDLADVYRAEADFPNAIETCKKGLRVFPNNGLLFTNIAWYYSLAGRKDEAVQAALAAARLQPDLALPYTNLCRAYNDTGDYNQAITACNNALKRSPDDGETMFYRGVAYTLLGKKPEATRDFDKAVSGLEDFTRKSPDYSDGFYLLGNAYYYDNQLDKAVAAYNKCLELSPRFARARFNLGLIHVVRKNKALANEQYSSLMAINPELAAKLKIEIDKM